MAWFEFRCSATMESPDSLGAASIHPTASSAASFVRGSGASQLFGRNAPPIFPKTGTTSSSGHREEHQSVSDAPSDPPHLPQPAFTPLSGSPMHFHD
jgi:hypothetical protein